MGRLHTTTQERTVRCWGGCPIGRRLESLRCGGAGDGATGHHSHGSHALTAQQKNALECGGLVDAGADGEMGLEESFAGGHFGKGTARGSPLYFPIRTSRRCGATECRAAVRLPGAAVTLVSSRSRSNILLNLGGRLRTNHDSSAVSYSLRHWRGAELVVQCINAECRHASSIVRVWNVTRHDTCVMARARCLYVSHSAATTKRQLCRLTGRAMDGRGSPVADQRSEHVTCVCACRDVDRDQRCRSRAGVCASKDRPAVGSRLDHARTLVRSSRPVREGPKRLPLISFHIWCAYSNLRLHRGNANGTPGARGRRVRLNLCTVTGPHGCVANSQLRCIRTVRVS